MLGCSASCITLSGPSVISARKRWTSTVAQTIVSATSADFASQTVFAIYLVQTDKNRNSRGSDGVVKWLNTRREQCPCGGKVGAEGSIDLYQVDILPPIQPNNGLRASWVD